MRFRIPICAGPLASRQSPFMLEGSCYFCTPRAVINTVDAKLRDLFDSHLERVLAAMPQRVHDLLAEVPLFVEDYPSDEVLENFKLNNRTQLCGIYTGVPLDERTASELPILPDVVTIFREGIICHAATPDGNLSEEELRRQIRITLLHELGHHHGMDEEELRLLGYD